MTEVPVSAPLPTWAMPDRAELGSVGLLLRLKMRLLRNRLRQIADQSPLRLLLVVLFLSLIWGALYAVFDYVFTFLRRFELQAMVAIPLVFHVFVLAMTILLTFSAAVLAYSALFGRAEPAFLLATPAHPRHIVLMAYLESLFFSSWSLVLLGLPMMMAAGNVLGLPWHFYLVFIAALLAFIPIPGAIGLTCALLVALWLPRMAARSLVISGGVVVGILVLWWGRLWGLSSHDSARWLHDFLAEMQFLKAGLLPSTWVTNTIRHGIENHLGDSIFYLGVTAATGLFFSWAAVSFVGRRLPRAFASAMTSGGRSRSIQGRASRVLTDALFFYLSPKMRMLVLKDVRNFLRDPAQWSQLLILFGLLGLYLLYLPRSRPEGFSIHWRALICFLNNGAITLILSTFTSRFVFPMISMEGRQMWLVGLWPMPRAGVMWAKLCYALTVCGLAAASVTLLSIRALDLPAGLAMVQAGSSMATCFGLCGLAVGLGARLADFRETSAGRVASGLGGTVNLVASVGLVTVNLALVGLICYRQVGLNDLAHLDGVSLFIFAACIVTGLLTGGGAMRIGIRSFERAEA